MILNGTMFIFHLWSHKFMVLFFVSLYVLLLMCFEVSSVI
uniref:Uncharacterized protein n=1 Tax=Arundo donax TaxID=35708 RepID=A0A0A9A904_ARUDO